MSDGNVTEVWFRFYAHDSDEMGSWSQVQSEIQKQIDHRSWTTNESEDIGPQTDYPDPVGDRRPRDMGESWFLVIVPLGMVYDSDLRQLREACAAGVEAYLAKHPDHKILLNGVGELEDEDDALIDVDRSMTVVEVL